MKWLQRGWDAFWKDEQERVVIWQWPNWPAWGFIVCYGLAWVLSGGVVAMALVWAGRGFLLVWAVMEIFSGVNYFRRMLGVVVLGYLVWSLF